MMQPYATQDACSSKSEARRFVPPPIVESPALDRPLSLVTFACQVWLHRLASKVVAGVPIGTPSQREMLAPLTDGVDLRQLTAGLQKLSDLGQQLSSGSDLSQGDRDRVRSFIRALDDHLVRTQPQRVHLLSLYASLDVTSAPRTDWVEPDAFFSAWAAGASRSKYEVLDRGRQAAAMVMQMGDRLWDALGSRARPASPYEPDRTLEQLLRRTCNELIGVVCLPASSGGPAATRYLATIGEIALEQVELHMFGSVLPDNADQTRPCFGSPAAWRLPRVLTRIGEISSDPAVAAKVWGRQRAPKIVAQARRILSRLLSDDPGNSNRPRSLPIEAYRFLGDPNDTDLRNDVLARLQLGRTAVHRHGSDVTSPPFGERGLILTREQAYTALILCEKFPELKRTVYEVLRRPSIDGFQSFSRPILGMRYYAAAYIQYSEEGSIPPLDAFLPEQIIDVPTRTLRARIFDDDAYNDVEARRRKVHDWFKRGGTANDGTHPVRDVALAVWDALRSAVDERLDDSTYVPAAWHKQRDHDARTNARSRVPCETDRILSTVPLHAREATRSLVAQAVLTIDGTRRRDAIEALRQAGLADVAAELFNLVVQHCRSIRGSAVDLPEGHPLDWLLENAVFCLSYTGSLSGFDTLVQAAGLATDDSQADPKWGGVPSRQPQSERWIRTTALLGLADLGDILHDAEGDFAEARTRMLIERIEDRLKTVTKELDQYRGADRDDDVLHLHRLWYLDKAGERRSLVAVLATLRSQSTASIRLLHVLSGRCFEKDDTPDSTPSGDSLGGGEKRTPTKGDWAGLWRPSIIKQRSETVEELAAGLHVAPKTLRTVLSGLEMQGIIEHKEGVVAFTREKIGSDEWENYMKDMRQVARDWDLVSWQLAEWGLRRIMRRFRSATEAGAVRVTDPFEAAQRAENRMRRFSLDDSGVALSTSVKRAAWKPGGRRPVH